MRVIRVKKGIISIFLIFTLITISFIGTLVFEGIFDKGSVAAETIIVDSNGDGQYFKIQDAIDAANAGDTVRVWAGRYRENIVISKSINLIGNGSYNSTIYCGDEGTGILIKSNSVIVSGFTISGWGDNGVNIGINLLEVENCKIFNNTLISNFCGISLTNSSYNNVENNANLCNFYGISLYDGSNNNTIQNNTNAWNSIGINIENSSYSCIKNNICDYNEIGISVIESNFFRILDNQCNSNLDGITIYDRCSYTKISKNFLKNNTQNGIRIISSNNISISNNSMSNCGLNIKDNIENNINYFVIDNNIVNRKTLLFWKNKKNRIIPKDMGQVILLNCTNITIKDQNLSNCNFGIQLISSRNNKITNCTCSNNSFGIYLDRSDQNLINNNLLQNNRIDAILIKGSNNSIINNICINNTRSGIWLRERYKNENNYLNNNICNLNFYGIVFFGNNTTIQNNICNSNQIGINIEESSFNRIENNTCNNNYKGIELCYFCYKNIISNNTCNSNDYGIYFIDSCDTNRIVANTCNKNGHGIYLEDSYNNTFSKNICNYNNGTGIYVNGYPSWSQSLPFSYNIVEDNICKFNDFHAIDIGTTGYTILKNNTMVSCGLKINPKVKYMDFLSIDNNNTVNGKELILWKYKNNQSVQSNAGQVILYRCNNITIEDQILTHGTWGIQLINSKNSTIFNNDCSNNLVGISLLYSDDNTIKNNIFNNNKLNGGEVSGKGNLIVENEFSNNLIDGVYLLGESQILKNNNCSNNSGSGIVVTTKLHVIMNNDLINNKNAGILLQRAREIKITGNNCENNFIGISIGESTLDCVLSNNSLLNCGLYLWSFNPSDYLGNSIERNNTINGKPIYYWKDKIDRTIPPDAGMVILVNCDNVTIANQNISNKCSGIQLFFSKNCIIKNNQCNNNLYESIILIESNFNIIENNSCTNTSLKPRNYDPYSGIGIKLFDSDQNIIKNNTCNSNRYGGIHVSRSNSNKLLQNNCSLNDDFGINIESSIANKLIGNNLEYNTISGINITNSFSHKLTKNSFISCGLGLFSTYDVTHWNSQKIDTTNTINGKPIVYWINKTGGQIPANAGSVILVNCSYIVIKDQNLSSGYNGITIIYSHNNTIENNMFDGNSMNGIYFHYSHDNKIKNNTCKNNKGHGLNFDHSCNNYINHNLIKNNQDSGIILNGDKNCEAMFFPVSQPSLRIHSYYSPTQSFYNNIHNNTFENNFIGINIYFSSYNIVFFNNIINNTYGIFLSQQNDFYWGCEFNKIYLNNFISNKIQAYDYGYATIWNNEYLEGNYWSDYEGLDNGVYRRIQGDDIGDTDLISYSSASFYIYYYWYFEYSNYYFWYYDYWYYEWQIYWPYQHLANDLFPLMSPIEFMYPPTTPILEDPGELDSDGDFDITWSKCERTIGYILEEDTNSNFNSPVILYNEKNTSIFLKNKINGTYFYRVKAYNYRFTSRWSNIVNITVDWPPNVPKNISVTPYPYGNTLNISWDLNKIDTVAYSIFSNASGIWEKLTDVIHPKHTLNLTGLIDGRLYYYRIRAHDARGQVSDLSEVIKGIPGDIIAPAPPTGLKVVSTTNDSILLTWNPNTEDDLEGYNIYRRNLFNLSLWDGPIGEVPKGEETYIDSGLKELTTYFYVITAFDEVPNESGFSNLASGTTILGQYPPEINNSINDFEIPEDTTDNTSINLFFWFKDINNDPLTFICIGQEHLTVNIYQNNGTVVITPEKNWNGQETLTFFAFDLSANISDNVTITVTPVNDPPGPPVILKPNNGFIADNETPIDFHGFCLDPDLPYGDILNYSWHSNLSGVVGYGEQLNNSLLPSGNHQITLKVTDLAGENASTWVNIIINAVSFELKNETEPIEYKPPEPNDLNNTKNQSKPHKKKTPTESENGSIIIIIIITILIIIIAIVYSLMLRKRKKVEKAKKEIIKEDEKVETKDNDQEKDLNEPKITKINEGTKADSTKEFSNKIQKSNPVPMAKPVPQNIKNESFAPAPMAIPVDEVSRTDTKQNSDTI